MNDSAALNIHQRINEVRKKVGYAKKDKTVEGQGYKAVTHDAITALARNHLIEYAVLVIPRLIDSSVTDIGTTKNGATVIRYAARYEVDFVNCDQPDDKITVPLEAHANDSGDKAPGKATSYATKYAMLKLFSIETGESDEARVENYDRAAKREAAEETLGHLVEKIQADDQYGAAEIWRELNDVEQGDLWRLLNSHQKKWLRDALQAVAVDKTPEQPLSEKDARREAVRAAHVPDAK